MLASILLQSLFLVFILSSIYTFTFLKKSAPLARLTQLIPLKRVLLCILLSTVLPLVFFGLARFAIPPSSEALSMNYSYREDFPHPLICQYLGLALLLITLPVIVGARLQPVKQSLVVPLISLGLTLSGLILSALPTESATVFLCSGACQVLSAVVTIIYSIVLLSESRVAKIRKGLTAYLILPCYAVATFGFLLIMYMEKQSETYWCNQDRMITNNPQLGMTTYEDQVTEQLLTELREIVRD